MRPGGSLGQSRATFSTTAWMSGSGRSTRRGCSSIAWSIACRTKLPLTMVITGMFWTLTSRRSWLQPWRLNGAKCRCGALFTICCHKCALSHEQALGLVAACRERRVLLSARCFGHSCLLLDRGGGHLCSVTTCLSVCLQREPMGAEGSRQSSRRAAATCGQLSNPSLLAMGLESLHWFRWCSEPKIVSPWPFCTEVTQQHHVPSNTRLIPRRESWVATREMQIGRAVQLILHILQVSHQPRTALGSEQSVV